MRNFRKLSIDIEAILFIDLRLSREGKGRTRDYKAKSTLNLDTFASYSPSPFTGNNIRRRDLLASHAGLRYKLKDNY